MTESAEIPTCPPHFGSQDRCDRCGAEDWGRAVRTAHTSGGPENTSPRLGAENPMGPRVQVVVGWLDDNGCLLPDPDGIAYRRTFSDWEQVPDAVTTHEHEWSGWMPGSHSSRYRCCLDPTCDEGEIQ